MAASEKQVLSVFGMRQGTRMPVEFLTAEQERSYGQYSAELNSEQLARYFHFDERDLEIIRRRRALQARLGFAIQLGTVRFLGTFLSKPTEIPEPVLLHVARQLQLPASREDLSSYAESQTHWAHKREISQRYGYRAFTDQPEHFQLVRWLYTRAWTGSERSTVLFDQTTARLVQRKILLPGVTTLARLVARVRDRVAERLWRMLAGLPTQAQRKRLEGLLSTPAAERQSGLDRLRKPPTRVSAEGLVDALQRLQEVRDLGVGQLDLSRVPDGRIAVLASHTNVVRAQAIARMDDDRRIATLLAFARSLEIRACDDALDLFGQLVRDLLSEAARFGKKDRLRTLPQLDRAALRLARACQILLDPSIDSLEELRHTVFEACPQEQLLEATHTVQALARSVDERQYEDLMRRYRTVRRFLPELLDTLDFYPIDRESGLAEALDRLRELEGSRRTHLDGTELSLRVAQGAWRKIVLRRSGLVDRRAYTLCAVDRLREGLKRREVFVERSRRWGDPRGLLLQDRAWEATRDRVCRTLDLPLQPATSPDGEVELMRLAVSQLGSGERERVVAVRRAELAAVENAKARLKQAFDELGPDHSVALAGLTRLVQELLSDRRSDEAEKRPKVRA